MKKIVLALAALVIITAAPVAVLAQGYGNMAPVGPPISPGSLMGPGLPMTGPGCQPPAPCPPPMGCPPQMGCQPQMGCAPSYDPLGPLSLYAGYLFSGKQGLRYVREPQDGAAAPDQTLRMSVAGVALGLSGSIWMSESFGVIGSGALLIPTKTYNGEYTEDGIGALALQSEIDAENQWGFLDVAGAVGLPSSNAMGSLQLLGGFRWDHFSSNQTVRLRTADPTVFTSTGKNDLTVDLYLPYIGGQVVGKTCSSRYVGRVLGSPFVPGNLKFQDNSRGVENAVDFQRGGQFTHAIKNGLWIEAFGEYSTRLFGDVFVGGFGRYNYMSVHTDYDNYTSLDADPLQERFKVDRSIWTLGGLLSIQFSAM